MQIKYIHVHTARNSVVRERSQEGRSGSGAVERMCARAVTVAAFPGFACVPA